MRILKVWAMLCATAAGAEDGVLKVFADKGSFFIRVDKAHPVGVGTELTMVTDATGAKAVGTGLVMEVTGALARITLDDDAAKAGAKFARVPPPEPAAAQPPSAAPGLPKLNGRLENGPVRVSVSNGTADRWTDCELRFNDGRTFKIGELAPHTDDTVLTLKFDRPPGPPEPLYDHVLITCDEGETKFMFADPHSKGRLRGYVENLGGGRIIVHNLSETAWNRCDIRKPDKSHYVMAKLKGNDEESIRSGNFIKEKELEPAPATILSLVCKQGAMSIDLTH